MIHDAILVAIAAVVAQIPAVAAFIKAKISKVEASSAVAAVVADVKKL